MHDSIERYRHAEMSLHELATTASFVVAGASVNQSDGRVAGLPDVRGIRYYQTMGLVQKPIRYDGRQAVYGYHHLLQLVAVKLLQAEGLSLAQVQQALLGTTVSRLERAVAGALGDSADESPSTSVPSTLGQVAEDPAGQAPQHTPPSNELADATRRTMSAAAGRPDDRRGELVAEEVEPGVFVLVDARLVAEPDAVLNQIRQCLSGPQGDQG